MKFRTFGLDVYSYVLLLRSSVVLRFSLTGLVRIAGSLRLERDGPLAVLYGVSDVMQSRLESSLGEPMHRRRKLFGTTQLRERLQLGESVRVLFVFSIGIIRIPFAPTQRNLTLAGRIFRIRFRFVVFVGRRFLDVTDSRRSTLVTS